MTSGNKKHLAYCTNDRDYRCEMQTLQARAISGPDCVYSTRKLPWPLYNFKSNALPHPIPVVTEKKNYSLTA